MQKVTIWHNPRCSKSRETLLLLQSRHKDIQIIDDLNTPPDTQAIEWTLKLLRIEPRELMRTNEDEYRKLHLGNPELTPAQLLEAMHLHPILIQRPVVFANGKACICRPPAAVLEIL
jgi:arsenate reductase (glutaredoxin)